MAHTSRCGSAKTDSRKCRCSCNGSAHGGGTSGIGLASGPTAQVAALTSVRVGRREATSKSSWSETGHGRNVIEQISDWLEANPTVNDQVSSIAEIVGDESVKAFDRYGQATSRTQLRLNHFLCGLLADFVRAINEFKQQLDRVPDRVIALILRGNSGLTLESAAARVAVNAAWRLITQLPVFGQIDNLLRAVRVAGVMTCPDPDAHEEVLRYCLYPLGGNVISEVTKEEIRDHLPSQINE